MGLLIAAWSLKKEDRGMIFPSISKLTNKVQKIFQFHFCDLCSTGIIVKNFYIPNSVDPMKNLQHMG